MQSTEMVIGDLRVDMLTRTVARAGGRIELQPREFELLVFLLENAGNIVTRAMILKRVWNYTFDPGTNVVDVRICCLRDKIDRDHAIKLIHTVRGAGYVIKESI
jgi:two-component system OmpR family response regulator